MPEVAAIFVPAEAKPAQDMHPYTTVYIVRG